MKFRLVACAAALAATSSAALAADWSDTSISYRYSSKFSEPAIDQDIAKNIVGLTHVSGYKYGSNFFNVDILKSDKNDPANNSTEGAQEVYVVYNHQLSINKTFGTKLAFGPVNDIALSTGFDLSAKNTAFAPEVAKIIVGPTFKLGFAGGWMDLTAAYYREHNNNGIVGKPVTFSPAVRLAAAWGFPFNLGPANFKFNGFLNYTGEKGKDGFGAETKPETLMDAFLMLDVGAFMDKKDTVLVGVGYEYWQNKFGNDHETTAGCTTRAPMIKAEVHF